MTEHEHSVKIAVLEEQMKGIREQLKAHNESTQKRFDVMGEKLDELLTASNKGKGAYAVLFVLSGAIGAAVIKIAALAISWAKQ